jgi:hypothetical protein
MSEQFDEQGNDFQTDDVEAHRQGLETDLGEDTEGHRAAMDKAGRAAMDKAGWAADKAGFEVDDVEGHRAAMDKAGWAADKAGLEVDDDDVEGHKTRIAPDDDDVEGHLSQIEVDDDVIGKAGLQVQPPRDADNQGNQF